MRAFEDKEPRMAMMRALFFHDGMPMIANFSPSMSAFGIDQRRTLRSWAYATVRFPPIADVR